MAIAGTKNSLISSPEGIEQIIAWMIHYQTRQGRIRIVDTSPIHFIQVDIVHPICAVVDIQGHLSSWNITQIEDL